MNVLPDGCYYSNLKVTPDNWLSCRAITRDWFIHYRYYDPGMKDKYPRGRLKIIKRMNKVDDLKQRRAYTQQLMDNEVMLLNRGFSPTRGTKAVIEMPVDDNDLTKKTPLIAALNHAKTMLRVSDNTMKGEIEWVITQLEKAVKALEYDSIGIWDITLRHLHLICEKASYKKDKSYSGNKFNRNKKVLRLLYKKLVLLEVAPVNYPISLDRQKEAPKKEKQLLTKNERASLVEYLEITKAYRFLLFIQIFKSSGARLSEMLRVKLKDVDFENQYITYLVLKGKQFEYKKRPMVDMAVGLWSDAIHGGNPDDYVWSHKLLPGVTRAGQYVVKMRWERICEKLGLNMGFYGWKYINTMEIAEALGVDAAAKQNAESVEMIRKHYDKDYQKREDDKIKGLNLPL